MKKRLHRALLTTACSLLSLSSGIIAQDTITIGTGTVGNGTTTYPCPLQDYFEGSRSQYLYRASELIAAGMGPGSISALQFNVTSITSGSFPAIEDYTLRIGTTSATSLDLSSWLTVPNTVFGPINYTPVLGVNQLNFTSSFVWNGVDNIVVEVCNGDPANTTYVSYTDNYGVPWTTGLSFNGSHSYRADNLGNLCGATTVTEGGTATTRPNMNFVITLQPCISPPTAGNTVASLVNVCSGGATVLSLQGNTLGGGQTYQWQSSANNSTWANIAGATGMSYTANPTSSTYYRCVLTCGSQSSNSTSKFVNVWSGGISGTYSMNAGAPVGGTTFGSFTELITVLACNGMSGPVTINVAPGSGPYNERAIFTGIAGLSNTKKLTINGNGQTIQSDGIAADPRIVGINGLKHIVLDGLTVRSLGTTYAYGIHFLNASDSNTVRNCTINLSSITSTSTVTNGGIVVSGSISSVTTGTTAAAKHLLIEDNVIVGASSGGGYYGIVMYGTTANPGLGHIIQRNTIQNYHGYGIRADFQSGIQILNNNISAQNRTSTTTRYGIYTGGSLTNAVINGNYIHRPLGGLVTSTSTVYGIYLNSVDATVGTVNNITNNIIGNFESAGTQYGIYSLGSDHQNIDHNTIALDYQSSTAGTTYGIYQTTSATGVNVRNNIVSLTRTGTGTRAALGYATTASSIVSSKNVLYVNPSNSANNIGASGTTLFSTLANWQTANTNAYDQNSVSSNPVFTNAASNDFTPVNGTISNTALVTGLATDFFGLARGVAPDPGAIEFVGLSGDVSLLTADLVRISACYSASDSVFMTISNLFGSTIDFSSTNLTANWSVTGPVNSSGLITVNSGTLAVGASRVIKGAGVNMSQPGVYTLTANINANAVNANASNDNLSAGTVTETVVPIVTVLPETAIVTSPSATVNLVAQSPLFPVLPLKFTEVTHFKSTTGAPSGGWPAWVTDDDNVEVSGLSMFNIEGYMIETWNTAATAPERVFSFPAGAELNSAGVAYVGWGGVYGAVDVVNNYYRAGFTSDLYSSSTQKGYILKSPTGAILDVVVYGNSFTWSGASGVTSSMWSGVMTSSGSSSSGFRRVGSVDTETASDWVVTTTSVLQNPGVFNAGINPFAFSVSNFAWSLDNIDFSTNYSAAVGPYTMDDTLYYVGTSSDVCGVYSDTAMVIIDLASAVIVSTTNVSCNGGADGSITATVGGGDAPYSYSWSNGDTTETTSGLSAGTYTVTISDANLWSDSATVVITEPALLTGATASTPSSCGVSNGTASIMPSGGTASYTYAWSTGGTNDTIIGLVSGNYTVTVTDANNCTANITATVSDLGAPIVAVTITTPLVCNGNANGQLSSAVSGGAAPYTYLWSNGATTASLSSLAAGTYSLTVTDSVNCSAVTSKVLTQPTAVTISLVSNTSVSCNGGNSGSIVVSSAGGTGAKSFLWSNGAVTATASSLSAGTYTVTATDANACTAVATYTVTQPTLLTNTSTSANVTCFGLNNGTASVTAAGGTMPYTYAWSAGGTNSTRNNLAPGTYTVTVTDFKGCTTTAVRTITQPTLLTSAITSNTSVLCNGDNNGSAVAAGNGGTSPYTYLWSNTQTVNTASALVAGVYTVTVTDNNSCTSVETTVITQPDSLLISTGSQVDVLCFGDATGQVATSFTGGVAPYSYQWSNAETLSFLAGVVAGTYTVTITDGNNCTAVESATITQNPALAGSANVDDEVCAGSADGSVSYTTTGGVSPYAYVWDDLNGSTTAALSNLAPGVYSLTVTDVVGCTLEDAITINTLFQLPTPSITGDEAVCAGASSTLDAGAGYVSYTWSSGGINQSENVNASGTYSVTVVDVNGCVNADSFEFTVYDALVMTLASTDVTCEGSGNGSIEASVSGGVAPYAYAWNDPASQTTAIASNLDEGSYAVNVVDFVGCDISGSDSIGFQFTNPVVDLGADSVDDRNPITLDAGAYSAYLWNTGANTQTISAAIAGSYSVTVTDANGCFGSDTIYVYIWPTGIQSIDKVTAVKLYPNPSTGIVNLELKGSLSAPLNVKVMSLNGQVVMAKSLLPTGPITNELLDLSYQPQGVYLVELWSGNYRSVQRVTIQ